MSEPTRIEAGRALCIVEDGSPEYGAHLDTITDYINTLVAWRQLNNAVRWGRILRPSRCNDCGENVKPEAHHIDYKKPLAVLWLCYECHLARHGKKRKASK